jgi:hypothetical protein
MGKSVLPVVLMEISKTCNTVHTKVYNNSISISLGEVAEAAEHLCHCLATRGLGLVELACPHIIGIFGQVILAFPRFRVRGIVFLLIVIAILWWISIVAIWRRSWPLGQGGG